MDIEKKYCRRCRIYINSKKFCGCSECSDEYDEYEGIYLCRNCCHLYHTLEHSIYDDFLDNKIQLDSDYKVYYHHPEKIIELT